jgi:signal transduction histidine kinase
VQDIQEAYEYGELDSAYLEESVHKCTSTIAHMSETIDDFRGFFNPSKDMTDFDINSEVKKALGLIDASFMNNNISIKLDIDKEVMAHGVSGEYSQVIVSILNNARDVLLNRKVESPEVSISTSYRDDMAVLEIEDNGGGILIEDINKIFEPYFTTKPKSEGTGIGLYFSKIIIEKHMSGYIKVENTERGAIFIVAVPGIFSD